MEYLIIVLIALGLALKNYTGETVEEEFVGPRETRLNPDFYVDEDAFMEVAHALGFRVDDCDTASGDDVLWSEPDNSISSHTERTVSEQSDGEGLVVKTNVRTRADRTSVMGRL